MSILIDEDTRLMVQGITGSEGCFHTSKCLDYGTEVTAGVTPGKGESEVEGVPVFDTVEEAVLAESPDSSLIFVPPAFAADAVMESADAGMDVIICITEGIPVKDMQKVSAFLEDKESVLIGPNCPGIISPGKSKAGIMPGHIHKEGSIGLISRSGTLTYEAVSQLTDRDIGQSTCIGLGGDPIVGTTFVDALKMFSEDDETKGVVMIGEIGGSAEEQAAEYIESDFDKPVTAFIAGQTAPPGRRMGHAGAIISGGQGTAGAKMERLEKAGVAVVENPAHIGQTMAEIMDKQE